jgi:carbon-monoxide dehydrogenase small subunit
MSAVSKNGRLEISCRINGQGVTRDLSANRVLADFLREDLGLTGIKPACGRGVCGACTVLIDGVPRAACSAFAFEADGAELRTIEGFEVAGTGALDPVQAAFARKSAFQCGFCTSGMITLVRGLLDVTPNPTRAEITEWISSNLCRCTGYALIIEAVEEAAAEIAARNGAAT